MQKTACISFWSVDAVLTLTRRGLYKSLSPELISRLSSFVDSYILFDKIHIRESYKNDARLKFLGGDEVFDFVKSDFLSHTDEANKGFTIDFEMAPALLSLKNEDRFWSIQHDPEHFAELYDEIPEIRNSNTMTAMRVWQWCLLNEMSERFNATVMAPNSLNGVEEFSLNRLANKDIALKTFKDFSQFWSGSIISAAREIEDPYLDAVQNFPPFLAVLLDRSRNNDDVLETLKTMRKEYFELRSMREYYSNAIVRAKSVGERREIVRQWDISWERMLSNEFKRSGLCSKNISSSEVIKMIFQSTNVEAIFQFLSKNILEHMSEQKRLKRFNIYNKISKDADSVYFNDYDLYKKFGIEDIVVG